MNKIVIFNLILSSCLISACTLNKKDKIHINKTFPLEVKLKGENIGPQNYFVKASQCILDSNILVVTDDKNDYYFHFFDLRNFKLLSTYGRHGRGPDEIESEPVLCQQKFIHNKALFYYVPGENKIVKVDIEYKNNKISVGNPEKILIPHSILNIQNVQYVSNGNFVARGCLFSGKLAFFNTKTSKVSFSPFYPKVVIDKNKFPDYYIYYYGDISYNGLQKKIACCNRRFNQIEIYSLKGNLIREIRFGKFNNPFVDISDSYYYYNAISTTSKYIYSGYLGVKMKNLKYSFITKLKTQMHVYDWDGSAITLLKLDRLTGYFCVDKNNNYFIAIDETNSQQPLVIYHMDNVFNEI